MTEPPDPRVDELRRQLRSLGYLDAGVDRFLLGSARQQGRPLSLATRASLRVGLLVAVAISLLLGHAQRITTLAVLAVAAGPAASLPAITNRSWRGILAGGAVAFAGAGALLLATASSGTAAPDRQPLTPIFPGRVYLVALDGFDPAIYEGLRDTLPNLRSAFRGNQVRLQPQDTTDPAR